MPTVYRVRSMPRMARKRMANPPAVIDGDTSRLLPTPRPIRLRLRSLEDVQAELARVYRDMKSGAIQDQTATRRAYVLGAVAKVIEAGLLERRITELEKTIAER